MVASICQLEWSSEIQSSRIRNRITARLTQGLIRSTLALDPYALSPPTSTASAWNIRHVDVSVGSAVLLYVVIRTRTFLFF